MLMCAAFCSLTVFTDEMTRGAHQVGAEGGIESQARALSFTNLILAVDLLIQCCAGKTTAYSRCWLVCYLEDLGAARDSAHGQ